MDKHISLSPCPFCGLHVELVSAKTYPNGERSPSYIKCKRCNYHIAGYEDKDVISQWNTRSAIRKEFCPNCEAETPCTHEAELFVCDICGEDFAKYIVSRKASVPDISTTQDVLTDIKTPSSIENTNPDYYKQELARRDEIITRLKEDAERLAATYVVEVFPHEWVCRGGCHHWARFGEQIDHAPDCPITLHRALMKELE